MCGGMSPFRHFFSDVGPIVVRDPLAEFVGAFEHHRALLEYAFDDVVKLTGYACPNVAAAFVCCKRALGHLHVGEVPERGNIAVTVHGAIDDGAYGQMGQVYSYVTGAGGPGGFKGLGPSFRRKDLLAYDPARANGESMGVTFTRIDKGKAIKADVFPARFPAVAGQERVPELMDKALRGTASHDELHAFQDLWAERIKAILVDEQDVDAWLVIQPA